MKFYCKHNFTEFIQSSLMCTYIFIIYIYFFLYYLNHLYDSCFIYKTLERQRSIYKCRTEMFSARCPLYAEWFQYQGTSRVNDTLNTEGIYQPFTKSSTLSLLYWTTDQTAGQLHIEMRGNSNWRSFGLWKMCVFNSLKLGCSGVRKVQRFKLAVINCEVIPEELRSLHSRPLESQ